MSAYGDFPPNVIELIQRQLVQYGRVGATKMYVAPLLSAVVPVAIAGGGGAPPTPSTSQPVNIRFRERGTIIGMYGQELRGTPASFATTWLRVQIGGQDELFRDDQKGVFFPILGLFGGAQNWFPIWRRAEPGVDWTVFWNNYDTGSAAFPSFGLAFIADADLARRGLALPDAPVGGG